MDPATIAGLTALFGLVRDYGPLAVVGIIAFFLVQAWRAGEFLSKSVHAQIVAVLKERLDDWRDRYKTVSDTSMAWRAEAERAAKAAEQAQLQHLDILRQLADVLRQVDELHDAVRDRRERDTDRGADRRMPAADRAPRRES